MTPDQAPPFISVEITHEWRQQLLDRLVELGYKKFKLVRQLIYNKIMKFEEYAETEGMSAWGSSGPFGEEAIDFRIGKAWRSAERIAQDWEVIEYDQFTHKDWYDVHATF
eukprot:TRINITY_DN12537_c0_g1_i1.p2 TRINITY_DN12537_c0_g1~~TRINITY_DN12537_c0_g1_i1.p2  ORF type:complete len:110 (+),score=16.12 TRINITY_DN12537_c0_g1_i1:547-876(+)